MEAENYLAGGYGTRLSLESRGSDCLRLGDLATVWQPSRLKGIQVNPEFGTPFLAATQVFDLRPVPRKWLALERTEDAAGRFVKSGLILVTCSGSVGRATLSFEPHEGVLISHDLLRVEAKQRDCWGWLYAYLRSSHARAMMTAERYGHIIKHLEVSHLSALPLPLLTESLRSEFNSSVQSILDQRNRGYARLREAEAVFEKVLGLPPKLDAGENGFIVNASMLMHGRRRFEAFFQSPSVRAIRKHFENGGFKSVSIQDAGFDVWLPNRFKRIPAEIGVPLLDSSDLFEINPDISRTIADGDFGDRARGRVEAGWLLMARSGQIYGLNGSVALATPFHEGKVVSDDIIRIAPNGRADMRPGYMLVALSHPILGRPLVKALIYGSSIPHIDVADVQRFQVVRLKRADEERIADLAEEGSELLARADLIENDVAKRAEGLLEEFISGNTRPFGLAKR